MNRDVCIALIAIILFSLILISSIILFSIELKDGLAHELFDIDDEEDDNDKE